MNRLLLSVVALVAFSACCQANPSDFPFGRIVNGEPADIENYPYQVSIQNSKGSHFCGGSLIDSDTILTAAHCVQNPDKNGMQVRLGSSSRSSGGEVVSVRAYKYHEGYNKDLMINDVAILKLSTPVRQTTKIRTIELADVTPPTGTEAVVTGFGTTCFLICSSTDQLMSVDLFVIEKEDCGSKTYKYGDSIQPTMVCAKDDKKDACQGDSGGPMVSKGKQVGVVSWGNGCARNDYPGVYASVADLKEWILTNAATL